MKIIFFLLSFVFVSCVTANTGKRDLSGVNLKPELSSIDNQFKTCVSDCTAKGGFSFWCSDSCLKTVQKENTTIKEANHRDCEDYPCVLGCICEGGSSSQCHRICG